MQRARGCGDTAAYGKVYLVGAGPGDPGLVTVKGRLCIERADVVVYDRLAADRLLGYARPDAELIYVGKLPDRHTLKQGEINDLLVAKARAGKTVTRLKGGDPFIFGRGGEEAERLAAEGIPFEIVPGVTSAVAAPAYAGIPLTHRDLTSSIGIITGHEDPEKNASALDWGKLATGLGTLVFLMGMENLPLIARQLVAHGRPAGTPVALVRWGTRPEQQTLTGTLGNIADHAATAGFGSPAVIVVGEVVNLRPILKWFETKPLFGVRVLVTRSRAQASALSERIEELGGEAWEFPVIRIAPPADPAPLAAAARAAYSYHWIVFTSANGVAAFFAALDEAGHDARSLAGAKLVAIGPQTAEELARHGLRADYVPGEYRAEAILAGLAGPTLIGPGSRVLLARADIARDVLPAGLRRTGAHVDDVVAYRTEVDGSGRDRTLQMLEEGRIQVVTFTSSSTVRNFMDVLGEAAGPGAAGPDRLLQIMRGVTVACIGPVTADTAREYGLEVDITASEYTINGLVEAICRHYTGAGGNES